ncbi:SufE family protein [Marinicella sp. W31]|uniref:SufE family protein n=1 Tax=Marinicella sp. W31 TaxID=3023713 RepID=UPI003757E43B
MNQQEVIETFDLFSDWMEKYQYIIDLGRKLEPLNDSDKIDSNLLEGCQSSVWLVHQFDNGRVQYNANSDAAIVSGLIALVLSIYSDKTPQDIIDTEPEFIEKVGLATHLSSTRSNGLASMINKIKSIAHQYL